MRESGVVGANNLGKTTLIEQLVSAFSKSGLRVATIKHSAHTHRFNTTGKDSYRHRESGDRASLAVSEKEGAPFFAGDFDIASILRAIELNPDVCVVEGDASSDRPIILRTRHFKQLKSKSLNQVFATFGPGPAPYPSTSHILDTDTDSLIDFVRKHMNLTTVEDVRQ
jgi:molybdopterin-guanine dinucleotide biosynthesis protein MobB